MKVFNYVKQFTVIMSLLILMTGCNQDITDFGFDGSFSGTLKDGSGNMVAGDITNNNLVVKLLGEGDKVTIDLRVKGDGTYQNTKIFPKKSKIWVTGPVTMTTDTLRVDFASNNVINHDFVVVPFITVKTPSVVGAPTASSITLSYEMVPNSGKVPDLRQVFVSTNPYPNATTGSGPFFHTVVATMTTDTGNVTVSGLTSKTKYHIRVAARAKGATALNFSDQIIVTTP